MGKLDGRRPLRAELCVAAVFSLGLMVPPQVASAQALACGKSAEQVFAAAEMDVVEIFSIGINQFRVGDRTVAGLGTGFILRSGVVVTNYHVIADAQHLTVSDGDWSFAGEIIGGDIITEVDGRAIDTLDTAMEVVRNLKVGQTISLTYLRNGERHSVSATLVERPVLEADYDQYRHAAP